MQDIDRPAHVQRFPEPTRARRPRVEVESLRVVPSSQNSHGIGGYLGRRRDFGQYTTVRPPESELAVALSLDVVALLVDRAMVPATEQGKIRERGGAAVRPVADVMPLTER